MSKQPNIRWRKSDVQELQRLINNYNNKLYRTKKNHPELADIQPIRVNMTKAKTEITTRADYNRFVKDLQEYTKRGNEKPFHGKDGFTTTKYEIEKLKRDDETRQREKRRRAKQIKDKEVKIGGKSTGVTRAEMGKIKENELKPNPVNVQNLTKSDFEKKKKAIDNALNSVKKKEQQERMKENYLKGLRDSGFLGANPKLEKIIRELDFDKFLETTQLDETATFDFYNDPQSWEIRAKYINEAWETAYQEYLSKKE